MDDQAAGGGGGEAVDTGAAEASPTEQALDAGEESHDEAVQSDSLSVDELSQEAAEQTLAPDDQAAEAHAAQAPDPRDALFQQLVAQDQQRQQHYAEQSAAMNQALQSVMQQNQVFQQMIQQAREQTMQQRQRAALEASKPQAPGPDATWEEKMIHANELAKWENNQGQQSVMGVVNQLRDQITQFSRAREAEAAQAQRAAQQQQAELQFKTVLSDVVKVPGLHVYDEARSPQAANAQAVLRALHEKLPDVSLPNLAKMLHQAFSPPVNQGAQRRSDQKTQLVAERAKVRTTGRPIPTQNASKAGRQVSSKEGAAKLYKTFQAAGMEDQFPADMKRFYGLN